jgi:hypothetical protein
MHESQREKNKRRAHQNRQGEAIKRKEREITFMWLSN